MKLLFDQKRRQDENSHGEKSMLRRTVKAAVEEVFEERKEMMFDLREEALLDNGLTRAIREGESVRVVSRQAVFKIN